ncbi:GNAT family N-acetyltransferase [Rhodopseudomonas boonkerdii]|uniref:GNAT family N-acetyltransferase n=1 Tax=Rhodopseudomonas boonkerdii TaxID=475937 RepID=UPI001E4774F8|nr:GNAT family N-acetyltransferase [Rhodopseudomonas boonkerdii]UGV26129.1 GNAT family N-acetyltransferase [Rhodopseudomonas boonkerdii]
MTQDLTIISAPAFSMICNEAFSLRKEVFVREQGVSEAEEFDIDDLTAVHLVALLAGEVVGTLRLVSEDRHIKIGRVAVSHGARGKGIAKQMISRAMKTSKSAGNERFHLAAQVDKVGFYMKLGFKAYGEEFMDGGMPHVAMRNYD